MDRIIREAAERGEFDDLPRLGIPIPGAGTLDTEVDQTLGRTDSPAGKCNPFGRESRVVTHRPGTTLN